MFSDYQCLETGTKGEAAKANRSIPDRVKDYGIMNYVTKDSLVLDLGCNRGFFGVFLSPHIQHYLGIDSDKKQIDIGVREMLSHTITNCNLAHQDFKCLNQKFDVILCLAFHIYADMPMVEFGKCLISMLNPNGHLFLEGHPTGYHLPNSTLKEPNSYWSPLTSYLDTNLTQIESKKVRDRELIRPFIHYQK
ncbi:hypothetical protein LCGC14_0463820 [marine sediment metagenome]|uniref:Methyltransferase domain-containing protein n=1 Tax=marine sediment metagenome TaxID=412755 RepID=A0A0F9SJI3_9ZZZZ